MDSVISLLQQSPNFKPDPDSFSPLMIRPAEGRVTDRFDPDRPPLRTQNGWTQKGHFGIDVANVVGTPIQAALTGVVLDAGFSEGYGNYIILGHDEGGWSGLTTLYAHMDQPAMVQKDSYVYTGQQIGKMGNTGKAQGSHLHFEVSINGQKKDPDLYVKF
jgi:murein DD-endopeptidase MepM/ murein hydrolase activator NlpD